MVRRKAYTIVYDPKVRTHLAAIDKKHHGMIRQKIEEQLKFEPDIETRNRKPLLRDVELDADWELRFGPDNCFRVFYAIDADHHEVQVLAIGEKQGNRLFIAGEEIRL